MRCYAKLIALLMLLVFAAASGSAMARGSGHGGGGHSGGGHSGGSGHRGGAAHNGGHGHSHGGGVGIVVGTPLFGLGYYAGYYPYPDYAYPEPDYSNPGTAGAYVEQGVPEAEPAQPQEWYYCAGANAYYPYVRECQGGWQRVPSQPQR